MHVRNQISLTSPVQRTAPSVHVGLTTGVYKGHSARTVLDGHLLAINLRPNKTLLALNSDVQKQLSNETNTIIFGPSGTDAFETDDGGHKSHFYLTYEPESAETLLGGFSLSGAGLEVLPPTQDIVIGNMARELQRHLLTGEVEGAIFMEMLTSSIFIRLASLMARESRERQTRKSGLSDACKSRLVDFIDANLASTLDLGAIAKVAEVPVHVLTRSFKRSFGVSLSSYLLERRLDKARTLLAEGNDTIAAIAYTCGFSSQQHMTNSFTAKVGATPARYRKEFGP